MRRRWLLCLAALLATRPAWAQEKKDVPTPGQEQFQAVKKELMQAQQELSKLYRAAPTPEEKAQIQKQLSGLIGKVSDRLFQIANDHPKDAGAEDALALLSMQLGVNENTANQGARALALLVANFPQSAKLAGPIASTRYSSSAAWEKPLRAVMESHPDPERQSQACLMLAENLRLRSEKAHQKEDAASALLSVQSEEVLKNGQIRFKETKSAKEYEDALFVLRYLTVGTTPPPIEAEDCLTAKPLKLSDYRGNVVVLCFFGNWCPPCRAMFPHERALVQRLAGKPFALAGVNSDKDRDDIKKVMDKEQISWPCFWDGGGTRGPIATLYRVQVWPTIYVLDGQGVIRYRNLRGRALDEAMDALLKEMKAKP